MEIKGSCLCGAYRFSITEPMEMMSTCYCSVCRKAHGTGQATFVACSKTALQLEQGEDVVSDYKTQLGGTRNFCKNCGSNLPIDAGERFIIPAGLLDGDPGIDTVIHIFVASKAPWVQVPEGGEQHEEYPPEWLEEN